MLIVRQKTPVQRAQTRQPTNGKCNTRRYSGQIFHIQNDRRFYKPADQKKIEEKINNSTRDKNDKIHRQ